MIVLTAQDIIKKLLGVTIEKLSFIMHNTITGYDKGVALRCRTCRIFFVQAGDRSGAGAVLSEKRVKEE